MGSLSCLAFITFCAAFMRLGQSCPPSTDCCTGHSGSTDASALWPDSQSPAGGPANNPHAAVCYFYRPSNCLICSKGSASSKCCTQIPYEQDDTVYGGPTPYNEFLIGKRYLHSSYGIEWYNLYPRKETVSGYYGYYQQTATGRSTMGLHPGSITEGCVTVIDDDECWAKTRDVVDSGSMNYLNSDYSGFLYVVMN